MAYEDIPPELLPLLDDLIGGGNALDKNKILAEKLKRAQGLADTEMPASTRIIGQDKFGSIISPTNPMQMLAPFMKQVFGGQQEKDLYGQMEGNIDKGSVADRAYMLAQMLREYPGMEQTPASYGPGSPVLGPPEAPIPGLGAPGQEGPDITEGRRLRKKAAPPAVAAAAPPLGATGEW